MNLFLHVNNNTHVVTITFNFSLACGFRNKKADEHLKQVKLWHYHTGWVHEWLLISKEINTMVNTFSHK